MAQGDFDYSNYWLAGDFLSSGKTAHTRHATLAAKYFLLASQIRLLSFCSNHKATCPVLCVSS
uniref:Uncharacterized protein n=1 Tax=Anguilla anguilla TaxID=7936 RepID=A0A0E9RUQ2_ANGAN